MGKSSPGSSLHMTLGVAIATTELPGNHLWPYCSTHRAMLPKQVVMQVEKDWWHSDIKPNNYKIAWIIYRVIKLFSKQVWPTNVQASVSYYSYVTQWYCLLLLSSVSGSHQPYLLTLCEEFSRYLSQVFLLGLNVITSFVLLACSELKMSGPSVSWQNCGPKSLV